LSHTTEIAYLKSTTTLSITTLSIKFVVMFYVMLIVLASSSGLFMAEAFPLKALPYRWADGGKNSLLTLWDQM
jgi:uncharacterized membrane protein